jgi:signal peptidase II
VALRNKIIIIVSIFVCFISDRITKIIAINFFLKNGSESFYYNSYLNFILTWNKGIAFGILESENILYHIISGIVFFILVFIIFQLINSKFFVEKFSFALIFGGALGNFFDRIYYSSVPDFIDFHFKDFHWFIFNLSDIWITLGIVLLIIFELSNFKKNNEK